MRKATSQTVWILITIVICLVVSLIIIAMFISTSKKAEEGTQKPIEDGGNAIKIDMCKRLCDSCMNIYGDDCSIDWGTEGGRGESCLDTGVNIECPYE